MTAVGIDFDLASWPSTENSPDNRVSDEQFRVPSNLHNINDLSFRDNVRTLSTNGVSRLRVAGPLYVPELESNTPCWEDSSAAVAQNATRLRDLEYDRAKIGFAPWTSYQCAEEYLATTNTELEESHRGFIFFVPGDNSIAPPAENWLIPARNNYRFPVYLVSGVQGARIMDALVDYSARNVADLPNGAALLSKYPDDPLQKFRVWADVRLDTQRGNPSLWLFLLIVVASLGGVLICLSFFLHWRARHRRARVRRMIISGEISLDVLGIRKATVPKDDIDKMPLYIYVCDTPGAQPTTPAPDEDHDEYIKDFIDPVTRKPIPEKTFEALSQPSCPICLDDYRSHTTVVRTLPCNHIFHPECIDKFLSSNSCLCPMCKSSALPKGYCPPLITNQMVRRVRTARLREQTRVKPRSDQYVARVLYKWRSRKLRRLDQRQGVRMEILRQNATQASLARQRRLERLQAAAAANAANAEGADVAAGTPGTPETAGAVELERRPELEGMTRAERGEVRRAEIEAQLTGGEGDPGEQRSSNRSAFVRGFRRVFPSH